MDTFIQKLDNIYGKISLNKMSNNSQFVKVILGLSCVVGFYKGFRKYTNRNFNEYLICNDSIFADISNAFIHNVYFFSYPIGYATMSVLFTDTILVSCPLYMSYMFYKGKYMSSSKKNK